MADISLTIKSNFEQASKDLKAFGHVSEATAAQIEKFEKKFKTEKIDTFIEKQARAEAAIKATRGEFASIQSSARAYEREIERLIKNGLDPESDEVQRLTKQYIKLQQEIEDTTQAEGKHEKASALTAASMVYLAQQAIDVGRKVVDVFSDLTTSAGDYVESVNAVNVVFEESGQQIIDFGENAKTAVGLSKTAFNELATTTGAMMKQAGISVSDLDDKVIELTKRAADTASVFNKDVNEALEAFNSVLRGEAEPGRRFAVNISDAAVQAEALAAGLVKNKNEITDQIKIQARYNLIMKQTSDFAGDFANTQDSFSNQLKIAQAATEDLKASLGESLIPAATWGIGVFSDLTQKIADYVAERNKLAGAEKAMADGNATLEDRILLQETELDNLNSKLINEVKALKTAEDLNGAYGVRTDLIEANIAETQVQIQAAAEMLRNMEKQKYWTDQQVEADQKAAEAAGEKAEADAKAGEEAAERAKQQAELVKTLNREMIDSAVERERAEIVARNNVRLAAQDAAIAQRKAEDAELAKTAAKYESTYNQIGGTISQYAGVVTDAFQGEKTAAEALDEILKDGAVKLLNMLGQEATARAAMATAKSLEPIVGAAYVPEAIGWGSAAAAAFLAAGVVGSFQTGTLPSGYTVPESVSSRGDSQYMRVNPGETVNVTPRGESSSVLQTIIVTIDSDEIFRKTQQGLDSGRIVIDSRNVSQRPTY